MKYGKKAVTVWSSVVILISAVLLPSLGIHSPMALVLIYGFVIGIGFGGVSTALTIIVQDSVDYSKRGTAVAANSLLRTLGQTIGISVFGNIFNMGITRYFAGQGIMGINPADVYQPSASQSALSAEQVKLSLNHSLHMLFIVFIIISCLSLLLSILMPKIKGNDDAAQSE
jgi:MFS family permease